MKFSNGQELWGRQTAEVFLYISASSKWNSGVKPLYVSSFINTNVTKVPGVSLQREQCKGVHGLRSSSNMEIIHHPPNFYLAFRHQNPPCLTFYHTFFCSMYKHRHTQPRQTLKGQALSISTPPTAPIQSSVAHPFLSVAFIWEQRGTLQLSIFPSVHHWIIFTHLCDFSVPSGEPAASGSHRVQLEGQEGLVEGWKGERHQSAFRYHFTWKLSSLFRNISFRHEIF